MTPREPAPRPPHMSDPRVLIVGAGPVGLTLALLLARQGIAFRIVDQNAAPIRESRATDIHARTLELFATIGLADAIIARGRKARSVNFYGGGRRIANVPLHELNTPHPFVLGIPQFETETLLIESLQTIGVDVERGVRLAELSDVGPSAEVTLEHVSGRPGPEHLSFDYVVGCDGANSSVRRLIGLAFEGASYAEHFMLADVRLDWELPADELHIFLSKDGFFQALPMPGERRVRLFVDVDAERSDASPTLETFERLGRERAELPLTLSEGGWMSKFRVHRRMVSRYRVGRVLLAGDAAHIHSPIGGQGMNTGIQDAWNLAWKLALVVSERASDALLDTYHEERHAVGLMTLRDTHLATRLSQLKNPVLRELRDVFSASLSSTRAFPRWMAEATGELRIRLPSSRIVRAERDSILMADVMDVPELERPSVAQWVEFGSAPGAGHRAPERTFGGDEANVPAGFYSLLCSGRQLVLLFDGSKATAEGYENLAKIADLLRARFGMSVDPRLVVPTRQVPESLRARDDILFDPSGDLHCGFGARAECCYVIRPDGYIGYRAQPARQDGLLAYLSEVLLPPR